MLFKALLKPFMDSFVTKVKYFDENVQSSSCSNSEVFPWIQ